jgi:hypothetical protein
VRGAGGAERVWVIGGVADAKMGVAYFRYMVHHPFRTYL